MSDHLKSDNHLNRRRFSVSSIDMPYKNPIKVDKSRGIPPKSEWFSDSWFMIIWNHDISWNQTFSSDFASSSIWFWWQRIRRLLTPARWLRNLAEQFSRLLHSIVSEPNFSQYLITVIAKLPKLIYHWFGRLQNKSQILFHKFIKRLLIWSTSTILFRKNTILLFMHTFFVSSRWR